MCDDVLTERVPAGFGQLHPGVLVVVHDVLPLDGLHVAQLVVVELHSSLEDFYRNNTGQERGAWWVRSLL